MTTFDEVEEILETLPDIHFAYSPHKDNGWTGYKIGARAWVRSTRDYELCGGSTLKEALLGLKEKLDG